MVMLTEGDAAEELQFASTDRTPRRVLAALPGVSKAVSGEFTVAASSFSLR
jgi:hypothetical protein